MSAGRDGGGTRKVNQTLSNLNAFIKKGKKEILFQARTSRTFIPAHAAVKQDFSVEEML